MKILLVGYLHGHGGIQHHTLWLARGLAERGYGVTIATPPPIADKPWDLPSADAVTIVPVTSWDQIVSGYPGGTDSAFDVAVVVGTGWKSMIGPLLNRRIDKRVFFEVMSGERMSIVDPRALVHLGFDAVVGQARPVEANFRKSFGWQGRSQTIPALSDPLEKVADIRLIPRPPIARGSVNACYFGRLVPHKGVGWLIDEWASIDRHVKTLDIWGTGDDLPRIERLIADRGLGERIKLRGHFPGGREYAQLLKAYDLKLLPTYGMEGAPLVLLEAMACGVPFVANGVGGIPDYENPDCRITRGSLADFPAAVDSLCEALYAGEVDRARLQSHYIEHFSYDALCNRWEIFLRDLVSVKHGNSL